MKTYTIIWDFDGTLLPIEPYDSEQFLLMYKINYSKNKIHFYNRLAVRALIYADRKQWIKSFNKRSLPFLMGTKIEILDQVCGRLADKISATDRQALLDLKAAGHRMLVLSCGTADLSERILEAAGLGHCFDAIEGNRFRIENQKIAGMHSRLQNPADKLNYVRRRAIAPEGTLAVGDGYTDIPLLDWAGMAALLDPAGKKRKKFQKKNYHFIASVAEVVKIIDNTAAEQFADADP